MFVIRPIALKDLTQIHNLARRAQLGITSLPKDKGLLEGKILHSMRSFSKAVPQADDELYFFVLEDLETNDVVGSCALYSQVGVAKPMITYKLEKESHFYEPLSIGNEFDVLVPHKFEHGPTEVATLFLSNSYRKLGLGRLLSFSRFLFMANFPSRVKDSVIAEMRGYLDSNGICPFWEHVGRHVFKMDFAMANLIRAENPDFMEQLLPKHPIYPYLLPRNVQEVIGTTYPSTQGGVKLLEAEGFSFSGHVDVFDGGPDLEAKTKSIRCVKDSRQDEVVDSSEKLSEKLFLISNLSLDFRCCLAPLKIKDEQGIILEESTLKALEIEIGDEVRYVSAKP
jgi:arginine N-succinyltransferase